MSAPAVTPSPPEDWIRAQRKAAQARALEKEAAAEARAVIARLRAQGLTLKEISAQLGISVQRVSQLQSWKPRNPQH